MSEQRPTAEVKLSYESRVDNVVDKKRAEVFGEIDRLNGEIEASDNRRVGARGLGNELRDLNNDKRSVRETNENHIQGLKDEWAELGGDELDVRQQNLDNPDEYGPNVAQFELKMAKVHMYENIEREDKESLFKTAEELSELQERTPEYDDKLKNLEEKFDEYAETFGLSEEKKTELMKQLVKAGGHEEVSPEEMAAALSGEDQPTNEPTKPEAEKATPEVESSEAERKIQNLERQLRAAHTEIENQGRTIESLQATSQEILARMQQMQEQMRATMEAMQATIAQQNQTIAELQERLAQGGEASSPADLPPTNEAQTPNPENSPTTPEQQKGRWTKFWENVKGLFGNKEKDDSQELEQKDRREKKLARHAMLFASIGGGYARNGYEVPAIKGYEGLDLKEWLKDALGDKGTDASYMESVVARMGDKKSIKVVKDRDTGEVRYLKIAGKKANSAIAIWALWPIVNELRQQQQAPNTEQAVQ